MTFDTEFEDEILAQCLRDQAYTKSAARILDVHHFSTEQHSWAWKLIKDTWINHNEIPSARIIAKHIAMFKEDERAPYMELFGHLRSMDITAPKAVLEELQKFRQFVDLQLAMESGAKEMEHGHIDKAKDELRRALVRDYTITTTGTVKWIEEFEERQSERKHKKDHPEEYKFIPTGIAKLDKVIMGIQPSELGLIMGTTGRGKSICLTNFGYNAVTHKHKVGHFSFEMAARQCAMRYDSRWTGIIYNKFKLYDFLPGELTEIDTKLKKMKDALKDRLRITSMPLRRADINSVRHTLEIWKDEGFVPDMLIMDSGDHLKAVGRYESYRLAQSEVYWDMKTLGDEDGYSIWSSTQAGKEWAAKTATAEASSETYDKSRIADIICTLNEPERSTRSTKGITVGEDDDDEDESEEAAARVKIASKMEMFLAKYRDGKSKLSIPLDTDFERMLIQEAAMGA
jgi:replicative DNA helicase